MNGSRGARRHRCAKRGNREYAQHANEAETVGEQANKRMCERAGYLFPHTHFE